MIETTLKARHHIGAALAACAFAVAGCGDDGHKDFTAAGQVVLEGRLGPTGGTLEAPPGGRYAGVRVSVPAGALDTSVSVLVLTADDDTPLPEQAVGVGPQLELQSSAPLGDDAKLTLPFDQDLVEQYGQDWYQVKVWLRGQEGWELEEPQANAPSIVSVRATAAGIYFAGIKLAPE